MPVPITPMYKDNQTTAAEYNVRLTGKVGLMKSKTKSKSVRSPSNAKLWGGVSALDSRHQPRSPRSCQAINQPRSLRRQLQLLLESHTSCQ
jgi:hypothetical protein